MSEKFWFLKRCDLFRRLTDEQISQLEAHSQSRRFSRNELVYLPSDRSESVFLLTSGRVKIYHITSDGKQALLALIEPGELFGELALFEPSTREEFAEAMLPSTVVAIPRQEMQLLMEELPNVAWGVTKLMGLRRRRVERRLKSLLFRSNRQRLIHLLLDLAESYGQSATGGVAIGIKLSHQDLANIIGSTRETVTVLLGELQSESLVEIRRRQIVLLQPQAMAREIDMAVADWPRETPSTVNRPQKASREIL